MKRSRGRSKRVEGDTSLMGEIERYVRRYSGVFRLTYEPSLEPKWHGVIQTDFDAVVASSNRLGEVKRRLGEYARNSNHRARA